MLAPYLILLGAFTLLPGLLAAGMAFTRFDGISPPEWVGLANVREMLADWEVWNGLRASAVLLAIALPVRLGLSLLMALAFHGRGGRNAAVRTLSYVPTIVPEVAFVLMWLWVLNLPFGPLAALLPLFPVPPGEAGDLLRSARGVSWLVHPSAAQVALAIIAVWSIGEGVIVLSTAVQSIPPALFDGARVDGASRWARAWHITLPLLGRPLALVAARDVVRLIQGSFLLAVLATRGGPYYATAYLPYYIYLNAADFHRLGYAAALSVLLLLVTALLIVPLADLSERWRRAGD